MSEAYVDLPHFINSPRTTSLILNLYHIRGSNSLSLHPSCCLMASLLDGIFIEPLDKALWSTSTFWLPLRWQLNSWWEIPSLTFNDLSYHWQPPCLISNTCLIMSWLYLGLLAIPAIVLWVFLVIFNSNPYLEHHVNATSKHDWGIPNINKNIGSTLSNVSWSIIQTPLYG